MTKRELINALEEYSDDAMVVIRGTGDECVAFDLYKVDNWD